MKRTLLAVGAMGMLMLMIGCSENNPPAATSSPVSSPQGVVITATPVVDGTALPSTATTATPVTGTAETPGSLPAGESATPLASETPVADSATPAAGNETPATGSETATPMAQ